MSFLETITPVLDCMCTALAEQGWEGQCCVNPGVPSLDNCCEGEGTAWGRLLRAYPSKQFPTEDFGATDSDCSGSRMWALAIELGAVRCVCFDMCDCAVKAANAVLVLGDAEAAIMGINCCFDRGPCLGDEYKITGLTILGPESGCGGFKIDMLLQARLACCPESSV